MADGPRSQKVDDGEWETTSGPGSADGWETLPSTGLLKQGGRVPLPSGKNLASDALSSIPYVASGAAGAMSGGLSFIPAVAASAAAGGAGAAAEQWIRKATGVYAPESGDEVKDAIVSGIKQGAIGEGGGRVLNKVLGMTIGKYLQSKRLYQSALKPTGSGEYSAEKVVEAGIKHGVVPGEAGRQAAQDIYKKADDTVARMIAQSPADIPPAKYVQDISDRFDKLRKAWGADPVNGANFVEQLDQHERQFLIDHGNVQPIQKQVYNPAAGNTPGTQMQTVVIQPEDMSLKELRSNAQPLSTTDAQDIKKQAWETVRTQSSGSFDPKSHPGLATEARQTVGRALKKNLEEIYPEIQAANKVSGEGRELEHQIDVFLKRELNKQSTPYFIMPTVGALAGGALGHGAGGAAGAGEGAAAGAAGMHMVRAALEDPAIKARIAIMLDRFHGSTAGKYIGAMGPHILSNAIRGEYANVESQNSPKR